MAGENTSVEARVAKLEQAQKRLDDEQKALTEERVAFEQRREALEAQVAQIREAAALANVSLGDEDTQAVSEEPQSFDLQTHIRNKSGRVKRLQLYNLWVVNKVKIFERPPGSGKFFYENNETAPTPDGYKPPGYKEPVKKRA